VAAIKTYLEENPAPDGRKFDAIKAARELYGYDLADAKRLVEGLVEN